MKHLHMKCLKCLHRARHCMISTWKILVVQPSSENVQLLNHNSSAASVHQLCPRSSLIIAYTSAWYDVVDAGIHACRFCVENIHVCGCIAIGIQSNLSPVLQGSCAAAIRSFDGLKLITCNNDAPQYIYSPLYTW